MSNCQDGDRRTLFCRECGKDETSKARGTKDADTQLRRTLEKLGLVNAPGSFNAFHFLLSDLRPSDVVSGSLDVVAPGTLKQMFHKAELCRVMSTGY